MRRLYDGEERTQFLESANKLSIPSCATNNTLCDLPLWFNLFSGKKKQTTKPNDVSRTCCWLNICVSAHQIHMLKPQSPACGHLEAGLREIIRLWLWCPHMWDYSPLKGHKRPCFFSHFFCHVKPWQEGSSLQTRKRAPTKHPISQDCPASSTVRNECLLLKPSKPVATLLQSTTL